MAASSTFLRFLKWKMDGKWKWKMHTAWATARGAFKRIASGDVGDNAEFARGANLPETFADAGGSRHEGLRLNKKSRFKLINWHTGEPVVSFQPSFSFTSK
jgi:hypothetical protein